jgi:hypothetical protein
MDGPRSHYAAVFLRALVHTSGFLVHDVTAV